MENMVRGSCWPLRRRCPKCGNKKIYKIENLKICAHCFKHKYLITDDYTSTCESVLSDLLCHCEDYVPKAVQAIIRDEAKHHRKKEDPEVATVGSWTYYTWRNERLINAARQYLEWRANQSFEKRVCRFTLELFLREICRKNTTLFQEVVRSFNRDEILIFVFRSLTETPSEYYSLLAEGREDAAKRVEGFIQTSRVRMKIQNRDGMPFQVLESLRGR